MQLGAQGIDLNKQVAAFCDAGGSMQLQASYDLLIGADGARSTVRDILQVPHCLFLSCCLIQPIARGKGTGLYRPAQGTS